MSNLVYIKAVGSYVPRRSVHNNELPESLGTSDEWIASHTGIRSRHVAAPNELASDLAMQAAQRALHASSLDPQYIDAIIVATSTPDYPGFPSTACVLQHKLNITHAAAFDISAACSGFIYGLEIGRTLVAHKSAQCLLLVCSEIFSRIVDWHDRSTCVLFGDAAAAVLLAPSADGRSGIIGSHLKADGTSHGVLTLGQPPQGHDPLLEQKTETARYLEMDGKQVYLFAVNSLIEVVEQLLAHHSLTMQDIRWVVPHQANERIIAAACKRAGYDQSKFYTNIAHYANTSAASIPLALDEMSQKGLLSRGDTVLTVGFGSGLTYGGNLIVW